MIDCQSSSFAVTGASQLSQCCSTRKCRRQDAHFTRQLAPPTSVPNIPTVSNAPFIAPLMGVGVAIYPRAPPPGSIPTHSTITLRSLIRNGFACSLTLIGHTSAASDSQQCSNGIKAAPRGQFITGSTWFQIGLSHSLRRGARTRLNTAARGH